MTAPSIGAKDLLVAASVGVFADTSDWGIYISKMPEQPDAVIAIYDSGGLTPDPKWLLDFPDITIQVRGKKDGYVAAQGKMVDVKNTLLGLLSQTINGDVWAGITQVGEYAFIGYDKKERPQFSATFRVIIEPANDAGDNRDPL